MPNKVKIDVELSTHLQNTKQTYAQLQNQGGFKNNQKAKQQIDSIVQELESLIKVTNPTLKQLTKIDALFNNLSTLLLKVAQSLGTVSQEFKDLQKELDQQEKQREAFRKQRTSVLKQGKINKDTGKYELFNSYQEEVIRQANIKSSKGKQIIGVDTFFKRFDKQGNPLKDNFQNPEEAKKIYDSLKTAEQENATKLIELNKSIEEYDRVIKNLTQQLKTQSQKEGSPLSGQIVETKVGVNQATEIAKEGIRNSNNIGSTSSVGSLTQNLDKQTTTLGRAFKQFTIYNVALREVKRALREALSTVKELDKELTEQAMVTGLTREQTYGLIKSYQDLALQTGATTKEIAGVATEYIKQGKSISDAMTLTEAAVSAAKVARVSTTDSVNYLTTALNGFQLAASDAMRVSDKFAAVAAASATDYDELAIALSKVASQANLAGMSIDYTTALLTKGLETTREAPETMGTALKTIIARMRELSDYGETLEGDTDINNVESQLAYIGIALRNQQGELRSTEDVLDELGKKWNTLNKNQQAAVAKALAGTRQQSRLIALMTDYERVTELQEISQRSAGATAAQAGVYLEGMEAALNKITVAWEKIVMAVSDSELIINTFSFVGDSLNFIGEFLSTDWGLVATLTTVLTLVTQGLTAKIQEQIYAKEQHKIEKENLKIRLEERKAQIKLLKTEYEQTAEAEKQAAAAKKEAKITAAKVTLGKKNATELQKQQALAEISAAEAEYEAQEKAINLAYTTKINDLRIEELSIESQLNSLEVSRERLGWNIASATTMAAGATGGMLTKSTGLLFVFSALSGVLQLIPTFINLATLAQKKQNEETKKGALYSVAGGLAKIWPWGPIAAVAALAIAGIAIAIKNTKSESDNSAKAINQLSNEIYKLQEKANAINQITSSFDKLDNKIIKTQKDMEEMNSLLEQVGDKLSTETTKEVITKVKKNGKVKTKKVDISIGGMSEQEYYNQLPENQKRAFAEEISKQARIEAAEARRTQIERFRNNSDLFNPNTTNAATKTAQTSIYANAVYNVQEAINELKKTDKDFTDEIATATEEVAQALVEAASLQDAFDYADNIEGVKVMIEKIKDIKVSVQDIDGSMSSINASKILTSDDYGLTGKVEAFSKMKQALAGSATELALLNETYSQFMIFEEMGQDVLQMLDYLEITIEDINKLADSWDRLVEKGINISKDNFNTLITEGLLPTLAETNGNIQTSIDLVFGGYLEGLTNYEEAYNIIVNSIAEVMSKGMLNTGQDIAKFKNTISSFYENAAKWSEMTETEKAEFMTDNATYFKGDSGVALLNALNTGNWKDMQSILQESQEMKDAVAKQLKYVELELAAEEARKGDEYNAAYIQQLRAWKEELENQTNLFRADLSFLIEQEEKQLNIYKDYLEKQQEQLEEALNKRKEAYEKYFDAINEQQKDEEYEETSNELISKLSQLSSSTDAASKKQAMELEQQLEELEEQRQEELRNRAQDAVLKNIDNEVEEINKKFDDLLNNEQSLLEAMQGEVNTNPNFLTQLLASAREQGMTNLQLEDFANQLSSTFGSTLDVSNISQAMEQIINNATINLGNQTFDLNQEDGNIVWTTLLEILTKYGYGR